MLLCVVILTIGWFNFAKVAIFIQTTETVLPLVTLRCGRPV